MKFNSSACYAKCHQHLGHFCRFLAPTGRGRGAGEAPLGNEETRQGHEGRQTYHLQIVLRSIGLWMKLGKLEICCLGIGMASVLVGSSTCANLMGTSTCWPF